MTENGTPDRWDIVLGHYVYASHHHSGQWSQLYSRLCRISKYARFNDSDLRLAGEENEGARMVYRKLKRSGFDGSRGERHGK